MGIFPTPLEIQHASPWKINNFSRDSEIHKNLEIPIICFRWSMWKTSGVAFFFAENFLPAFSLTSTPSIDLDLASWPATNGDPPTQGKSGCWTKNRGVLPPKWMVKIMVPNPMNKWMIWGAHPYFWKHPSGVSDHFQDKRMKLTLFKMFFTDFCPGKGLFFSGLFNKVTKKNNDGLWGWIFSRSQGNSRIGKYFYSLWDLPAKELSNPSAPCP